MSASQLRDQLRVFQLHDGASDKGTSGRLRLCHYTTWLARLGKLHELICDKYPPEANGQSHAPLQVSHKTRSLFKSHKLSKPHEPLSQVSHQSHTSLTPVSHQSHTSFTQVSQHILVSHL